MKTATVEEALENVSEMMKDAGFEILEEVRIAVDKKLPFMGYTTTPQGWKNHVIVVSGFALNSGLLEELLIHELSHIYRIQTNHPSHNQRIIGSAIRPLVEKGLNKDHQLQALHAVINHIQDLYADDISFKVMKRNQDRLFHMNQMSGFFQSWVKDTPAKSRDDEQDSWTNASIMLSNAFALSNMTRHDMPDIGDRAGNLNQRFLSRISSKAAARFGYFREVMSNLKEDIDEEEFGNLLESYCVAFLDLIRII